MISLITTILLGYVTACLVSVIDFSFNEGNLFDFYYKFLLRKVKPFSNKLAKPLGLCPVCMGFWVGLVVFCTLAEPFSLSYELFILFAGVNGHFTMKNFNLI